MTIHYDPYLHWIEHQRENMEALLELWSNINSGTFNLEGLQEMLNALKKGFKLLDAEIQEIQLNPYSRIDDSGNTYSEPVGKALHVTKRPGAKIRIFFGGHMDTVYDKKSSFQKSKRTEKNKMTGPGVADMKGGLIILLTALQALEKSPYASQIGWEVYISPDEEVGSPSSQTLLEQAAKRNHFGMLFEPSFSDGSLVRERAGSANFTLVVRGKSAHVGRDFHKGRSAIFAIANIISDLESLNQKLSKEHNELPDLIVSVGKLNAGTATNTVPDLAIARFNVRASTLKAMEEIKTKIENIIKKHSDKEGITIELKQDSYRAPKAFDKKTEEIFELLSKTSSHLGQKVEHRSTRGVSDGNILANSGLPNVDSLGAVGGDIHTSNEYIMLDSLIDRAKLVALLLMKIGNSEFDNFGKKSSISL